MEKEQYYIFVVYKLNVYTDPKNDYINLYNIDIKRCAKTKGVQGERNKYKRIKVNFDPIDCTSVWVLYAIVDRKEKSIIIKDDINVIGVYLNENDATNKKISLETTDYQEILNKNELIKKIEIINLPIIDDQDESW